MPLSSRRCEVRHTLPQGQDDTDQRTVSSAAEGDSQASEKPRLGIDDAVEGAVCGRIGVTK